MKHVYGLVKWMQHVLQCSTLFAGLWSWGQHHMEAEWKPVLSGWSSPSCVPGNCPERWRWPAGHWQTWPIEFWLVYTNTSDGTKQPICLKMWKLPFMFHIYIVDITCAVSVHQCLQSTGVWQVYSVVDNTVRVELVYKFPNGLEICLNEKLIEHGFADKAEESFRSQVCICQRYVCIMYIVRTCHRYVCIKICCRHLSHLHLYQGVSYMTRLGMSKRKF